MKDDYFIKDAMNSVGYHESGDKQEFLKGANIAIKRTKAHYERVVQQLKSNLASAESQAKHHRQNLHTIHNILNSYRDEE